MKVCGHICHELEVNDSITLVFHFGDFILKIIVSKVTENHNGLIENGK